MPLQDPVRRSPGSPSPNGDDRLPSQWVVILLVAGLAAWVAGSAGGPVAALTVGIAVLGTLAMIVR